MRLDGRRITIQRLGFAFMVEWKLTLYVCTYVCILCALHDCFHVVFVIQIR